MPVSGNIAFDICNKLITNNKNDPTTPGMQWVDSSGEPLCSGPSRTATANENFTSFKQCLDGLVLAPFVVISFLKPGCNNCPAQTTCNDNQIDTLCGIAVCQDPLDSETQITIGNVSMPGGAS